jgi:hypothetical protein
MNNRRSAQGLLLFAVCASCGGNTRLGGAKDTPAEPVCDLQTDYADDEACLTELDSASGFSLHFGPDDHDAPGDFVLPSGEETTECRIVGTLPAPLLVERWVAKSRSNVADFELLAAPQGVDPCRNHRARLLAVSEDGELDVTLGAAPEYAGAALPIGPDEQIAIQVHAVNTTEAPVLREVWVNAHAAPQSGVNRIADTLALVTTVRGTDARFGGMVTIPSDRPLLALSGHVHPNIETLDVILVHQGERTLLYRQNGFYSRFLKYDSVTENPQSSDRSDRAGGPSGSVILAAGDVLAWECQPDTFYPGGIGGFPSMDRELTCALRGWYLPSDGHWVHEQ